MAVNWGNVGTGAATGATTGAMFGPWGAAGGAVLGGLFGALSPDGKSKLKKVPTGTKQQQQFGGSDLIQWLQDMMNEGGSLNAANQYDQSILKRQPQSYEDFSSPYLQEFTEKILPMIAEKYAGSGALSSSGFGQAIGGAGAGLQSQLAKLYSDLQLNWEEQRGKASGRIQNQFQNLSNIGLNYEPYAYYEKQG